MGAKRLGYGGETTSVENRGETTRGKTTRGETSLGRNVLLPVKGPKSLKTSLYLSCTYQMFSSGRRGYCFSVGWGNSGDLSISS